MPRFRYRAVGFDGAVMEGETEAPDRTAAVARIRGIARYPMRVDEVPAGPTPGILQRDLFGPRRIRPRQIALVTRELATLLEAGLPLDRALTVLRGVGESPQVAGLLSRVQEKVRAGSTLADAMAAQGPAFPRHYVSMVRAGEAGGSLEDTLARLADLLERTHALRETVKSALVYPIILLVFAGVSVVVLLTMVLPQFEPLFEGAGQSLPWATRLFMGAGDALGRHGLTALAVGGALAIGGARLLRDPRRRLAWDAALLRLPLVGGLVARAEAARFTRTLGTLLSNGVPILTALSIVADTLSNRAVAAALGRARESLQAGEGIAAPLEASGAVPPLATHLIRVGEETGALEAMLAKAADIHDQEVERAVQRLLALLVPGLTVALGLLVAGIISSILVAILSVNELAL